MLLYHSDILTTVRPASQWEAIPHFQTLPANTNRYFTLNKSPKVKPNNKRSNNRNNTAPNNALYSRNLANVLLS
jgi:hypothetical protein